MRINRHYTEEKIRLAKKIAPLMPEEYVYPIQRSIYITENLMRILELQEHLSSRPNLNLESEVTISDNKERLRKIISTVQNEAPESRMGNMGFILDFIVNFDKYQRMLTLLNTLMKNQNLGQDRDKLLKMVEPIMEKESPSGEASLDIEKIIQIISLLNKTKDGKKEPEGEDRQVKPEANSKKPDKDMPKKESSYEEKDKEGMEKEEGDKKELAKEKMVKKESPEKT